MKCRSCYSGNCFPHSGHVQGDQIITQHKCQDCGKYSSEIEEVQDYKALPIQYEKILRNLKDNG